MNFLKGRDTILTRFLKGGILVITVKNVTKKYGNFKAIDNISFEIKEGEIVGLLGPNGAGKSTTMNMLTGFIEPTEGQILINDFDILKKPKKAKLNIGYMPENVPLYMDQTVKEFVNYMADLKMVPKKQKKESVESILKETGLIEVKNKLIRNLSRGYKQRVSMAGALVGNPKILILDEPTVGLDPKQITEIRSLIKSLGKNHTLIISSHILSEISQLCEKVIIINNGKIIAQDTPQNLESKVQEDHSILVTVEDPENKMTSVASKIDHLKDLSFIKDNEDGTKQYLLSSTDNSDLRKTIFELFAKEGITIFELKKSEATLEDAFIKLVGNNDNQKINSTLENDMKTKKEKNTKKGGNR